MRRPAVLVLLTAAALALAGCSVSTGGSSGWTQKPGASDKGTPTSSPITDDLASCLEGTWELDETVLPAVFQAVFAAGLVGAEEGVDVGVDSMTASQTVTFVDDETFASATQMTGSITATFQGQSIAMDMTIDASASGTWRTSNDKMAIVALDGEGTMTMTTLGQTETEDLGSDAGDVVMLPTTLEPVTCHGNTLTWDGTGMSLFIPDAPDTVVFTRR